MKDKMNKLSTTSLTLIVSLSLTACVKQEPDQDAIPPSYKRALQKAEGVEKTLQDNALKGLDSIDESSE
ncbi:MAG: hypothetical protein ACJA09_003762 [Alcanivorax sp.]|jgi:hypothetical protein